MREQGCLERVLQVDTRHLPGTLSPKRSTRSGGFFSDFVAYVYRLSLRRR